MGRISATVTVFSFLKKHGTCADSVIPTVAEVSILSDPDMPCG